MTPLFAALAFAGNMPGDDAAWDTLTNKPVRVECVKVSGKPWCRSTAIVQAPLEKVAGALQNMRYNADLFDSVIEINVLSPDVLHVLLDYPSPLEDRDYVARYTHEMDGDAHVFTWVPEKHPGAPETDRAVRLPAFEGEWRLESRDGGTWVRYTWQAEIAGSFPKFGYNTAWKRAGHEALKDLANTQKAKLSAAP